MIYRLLLACGMLLCSGAALRWLLIFWTPRCNEECARHTLVSIYGLVVVATAVTLVLASLVATGRWHAKRGAAAYAITLVVAALAAVLITP